MAMRSTILGNAILNKNNLFPRNKISLCSTRLRASNLSENPGRNRHRAFKIPPCAAKDQIMTSGASAKALEKAAEADIVSAVLFDMDGVLCNSEEASRLAAVD
ncbi:hypothetical protein KI387_017355, partial [Taxus chinensis]